MSDRAGRALSRGQGRLIARNLGGDQTPHPEWAPEMPAALADLQRELEQAGWRKVNKSKEFWSWTYRR